MEKSPKLLSAVALVTMLALPEPAHADALQGLADELQSALGSGSFAWALALIFAAGVVTSLTPCVYPMIAITVSIFGAKQAKTRLEGGILSLAFVLGIAALFTPLGIISAFAGEAMSTALSNPWVLTGLAVLFIGMALSMFGAWDMALPSAWQSRLAQVGGSGVKGAFGVGFVNGIIAAPCTGPVLTVLLAYVGTTKSVSFGAASLFVYSLGLGLLFFIVGTFAIGLPKSGRWLDHVKSFFGVVMLVLAAYYLRDVVAWPRPEVRQALWLWVPLALVGAGAVLGAFHLSFKGTSWPVRVRKAVAVTMVVAGGLGAIFYLDALPPGAHIEWSNDFAAAEQLAHQTGKPLLVDFGASWCGACGELDRGAMSDPRVVREAQRFVTVRVDLSPNAATPERWALLRDRYRQPGLPLVVMHAADGSEVARVVGVVSADEFLDKLRGVR